MVWVVSMGLARERRTRVGAGVIDAMLSFEGYSWFVES